MSLSELEKVQRIVAKVESDKVAFDALREEYDELYRFLASIVRYYPLGEIWLDKDKIIPAEFITHYRIDITDKGPYTRLKVLHLRDPLPARESE